ncbi:hypothetical protein [Streptomyces albidoflavus]|uniref:hypothetical protein n=1 Tax=Streptomyces albidoflavus TaxID=1886 RepID=UPI00225B5C7E|nr:hypothetical protein [Streptomyces albidoflavus]MCX4444798.1 hypothetical protein [Streptomyces albidoflavus]
MTTTEETARRSIIDLLYPTYGQQDTHRTVAITDAIIPIVRSAIADARRAALDEALEAVRQERLTEDTNTPEDEAYGQALNDAIRAIEQLQ